MFCAMNSNINGKWKDEKYEWNDFPLFSDRKTLLFTDIIITTKLNNQTTNQPAIQTAHQNDIEIYL